MSDNPRCEYFTPDGKQCTRPGVKTTGEAKWWCGQSHEPPDKSRKIDRNGPCPCGSGRKYKKCCALVDRMNKLPRDLTR
jgi:uncharacterized protein YecA (UPF0149 family)